MRKSFAPILVIGICLLVIAATAAVAEHYSGSGYDLWTVPNSGSSLDLTNGTYHLQDIKGYPFGFYSGSGYSIITGIGVLTGGGVGPIDIPDPFTEDPYVQNLRIARNGVNLDIDWDSTAPSGTNFYVYKLTNLDFQNADTNWTLAATVAMPTTIWQHTNQADTGDSKVYYRVISSSTKADLVNKVSVGKYNMELQRATSTARYVAVSSPFVPQSGFNLNDVLPPTKFKPSTSSLALNADQVQGWNGTGWEIMFKSTTDNRWKRLSAPTDDGSFVFCKGYYLKLRPTSLPDYPQDFMVTLIGSVLSASYESSANYGGAVAVGQLANTNYTAFGNPAPMSKSPNLAFGYNAATLQGSTLSLPLNADQIQLWDPSTPGWKIYYYNSSTLTWRSMEDAEAPPLEIGKGYYFRKADGRTAPPFYWVYPLNY